MYDVFDSYEEQIAVLKAENADLRAQLDKVSEALSRMVHEDTHRPEWLAAVLADIRKRKEEAR